MRDWLADRGLLSEPQTLDLKGFDGAVRPHAVRSPEASPMAPGRDGARA